MNITKKTHEGLICGYDFYLTRDETEVIRKALQNYAYLKSIGVEDFETAMELILAIKNAETEEL